MSDRVQEIRESLNAETDYDDLKFCQRRLYAYEGCAKYLLDKINALEAEVERYKTTAFQAQNMAMEISDKCKALERVREAAKAAAEAYSSDGKWYVQFKKSYMDDIKAALKASEEDGG